MALASGDGAWSLFGSTRLSKGLALVFATGYVLALVLPWTVEYLALVPGRTIPFAWNVVTAGYFEHTFLGLVSSVLGIVFFGKLLEPIWTSRGMSLFIILVNFFTTITTFALSVFLYYVTSQGKYLYVPISGFSGVLAGFLVAVKQLMPDYELPKIKLRAKWFPSLLVAFFAVLYLVVPDAFLAAPYIIPGTYISWIYLRYHQTKPEAKNVKGDSSDEFAFSTFFPQFMRPVVHPVATFCDKLCCGRRNQSTANLEDDRGDGSGPLPGSDPIEASRRRERGARALEERLNDNPRENDNANAAEENV
ncbi:rhomboid-like protein 19 [Selaginella moellendorffii]|nr:rhomboid-like protein 19 [Selaginella moellendorffii]|eukprot:XP_002975419.2 rhomboid-like protein 19 [Selaginella moellendorffii]